MPARVQRKSAGEAMGLTVGPMGDAWVQAPAWLESEARFVIDYAPEDESSQFPEGVEQRSRRAYEDDAFSRFSRAALVVAALAFSPIGVLFGLLAALYGRLRK